MADEATPPQSSEDMVRAARGDVSSMVSPSEDMVRKARRSTGPSAAAGTGSSTPGEVSPAVDDELVTPGVETVSEHPGPTPATGRSTARPGRVQRRPTRRRTRPDTAPVPVEVTRRALRLVRGLIPLVIVAVIVGANLLDDQKDITAQPPPGVTVTMAPTTPQTLIDFSGATTQTTAPSSAPSGLEPGLIEFGEGGELRLIGTAAPSGPVLRLTPSRDRLQAGAAWLTTKQAVADGFETAFRFRISGVEQNPGDGFAFVIQNSSESALGTDSFGIGYNGVPNSVAVEFDTVFQGYSGDPGSQHIGVHTLGTAPNSSHEKSSLGSINPTVVLADGKVHSVTIEYSPGTLSVFLDDLENPVLEVELNLADTLTLDAGRAWVGFTASTEPGFRENHDIVAWSFSSS